MVEDSVRKYEQEHLDHVVTEIKKAEGKAEQKALDDALRELTDMQKMQKAAVKACKQYTSCLHFIAVDMSNLAGGEQGLCCLF